jgi:hypothetical protein
LSEPDRFGGESNLCTPRDEARFTVRRIVWSEELAEAEVHRLQELNADAGCQYFWQYTRVDRQPPT